MADASFKSPSGPCEPCIHSFSNQRSTPVQTYWINFDGLAVLYGKIDPGSTISQGTYVGHAWRLCDERSGVALAEYAGGAATITLQADGSVRVAALPAEAPLAAEPAAAEPAVAEHEGPDQNNETPPAEA